VKEDRARWLEHLRRMDNTGIAKWHSITQRKEEEILNVQGREGKLKPEQEDYLCYEMKMKFVHICN